MRRRAAALVKFPSPDDTNNAAWQVELERVMVELLAAEGAAAQLRGLRSARRISLSGPSPHLKFLHAVLWQLGRREVPGRVGMLALLIARLDRVLGPGAGVTALSVARLKPQDVTDLVALALAGDRALSVGSVREFLLTAPMDALTVEMLLSATPLDVFRTMVWVCFESSAPKAAPGSFVAALMSGQVAQFAGEALETICWVAWIGPGYPPPMWRLVADEGGTDAMRVIARARLVGTIAQAGWAGVGQVGAALQDARALLLRDPIGAALIADLVAGPVAFDEAVELARIACTR